MTSMTLHLSRTYSADVLCVRMYVGAFVVKKKQHANELDTILQDRELFFSSILIYIYIYI